MPDINMGWIINPEIKLEQADTHFDAIGQGYFWAPLRFYDKYTKEIDSKNPLYLGYLFHLWLDVSFMTAFVSKIPMSRMVSDRQKARELKWKDSYKFIQSRKSVLTDAYIADVNEQANEIDEVQITRDDLLKVIEYLNSQAALSENSDEEYQIFTEDELEQFYEKTCRDFTEWVNSRPDKG